MKISGREDEDKRKRENIVAASHHTLSINIIGFCVINYKKITVGIILQTAIFFTNFFLAII